MNNRETARYDMFLRVGAFGKDNAADFAPGSEAAKHFAALVRIVSDLDNARAGQQAGGTTAKSVLLDALRLDLQNIARTARAIAQDAPGFADKFPPPASNGQDALVAAANAYLGELKKNGTAARFIAHELPADFVQHLTEDLAAIAVARDQTESTRAGAVASTASVGQLIADSMKEVTYLDAIVNNKYARVPDKLRAWEMRGTPELLHLKCQSEALVDVVDSVLVGNPGAWDW